MSTIACNCTSIGSLSKMLTTETGTAPRTFNATSNRHEFIFEKVGSKRAVSYTGGITGSLSRLASGVSRNSYIVQGTIALQASPSQLSIWLPRIFGGPLAGTSVGLSNTIPTFDILLYREAGIFQITDAVVAQALIRGRTTNGAGGAAAEFIELIINVIGKQELLSGLTWPSPEPALSTAVADLSYSFWESDFTLDSVDIPMDSFSFLVDNNMRVRFYNERYPTCIRSAGRDVKLDIESPFTCTTLAKSIAANEGSLVGQLKFTTTDMSTTFDFAAMRNTYTTPTVPGKSEIPLEFSLEAFKTASTNEVVITHDANPAPP